MFRLLQGIPRALRNKAQVGYTTHQRSPSTAQQTSHQDEGVGVVQPNRATSSSLSKAVVQHPFSSLHTCASGHGEEDKKHQDDWNRFKKHNHWQNFRGAHDHYEAVGWGTAIIISLQLCRALSIFNRHENSSSRQQMKYMIASVAHAMPRKHDVSMHVLDDRKATSTELLKDAEEENKAKQNDATETLETSAELNEAFQKLQNISEESIGVAHNALGLHEAKLGNLHEAAEHFLQGSLQGYSKAQFNMAVCYEQGRGVTQNITKAVELYQAAASHGHAMAQYNLGVFHLLGRGDAVMDPPKALELIIAAADQGLTQAQSYLGAYYMNERHQDTGKAVELLKQAAQKQDAKALFHLGVCYHHGLGIECNTAKAATYFYKAANKGYVAALYSLAMFYEQGLGGLPQNMEQAEDLYRRASHKGCKEAQLKLKQVQQRQLCMKTGEQSTEPQTELKCDTKTASLKRTKTQNEIKIPIHTSASEPVITSTVTSRNSANIEPSGRDLRIAQQLSYLSLFLPYYFNMAKSRSPAIKNTVGGDEMDQRSRVMFQVGEEIDEAEAVGGYHETGLKPVVNGLNTGTTPFLTVS